MSNRQLMNIESDMSINNCNRGRNNSIEDVLAAHTGETVTIYTTSGGESGAGFTGVIFAVLPGFVRLICEIGAPPSCALNTSCNQNDLGGMNSRNRRWNRCSGNINNINNSRGCVVIIPTDKISSFVHNAL